MEWKGRLWLLRYVKEEGFVDDLMGIRLIASLVDRPHHHWSHLDLAVTTGKVPPTPSDTPARWSVDYEITPIEARMSRQPIWDEKTKATVTARLIEVKERIRTGSNDPSQIAAWQDEIARIEDHMRKTHKPAGTSRAFRDGHRGLPNANSVGRAIRTAIKHIAQCGLPSLADHLTHSIDPYSSSIAYRPEDRSIQWDVFRPPASRA